MRIQLCLFIVTALVVRTAAAEPIINETRSPAPSAAGSVFEDCDTCPEMIVIPAGRFQMGSDEMREHERPVHAVSIRKKFAVSRYPVTVGEFRAYMEEAEPTPVLPDNCWVNDEDGQSVHQTGTSWRNPGFAQDDNHPVVCVSWSDAQHYIRWLSAKTGRQYRFLSEAEWEYIARADSDDDQLRRLGAAGTANHGAAKDDPDACCWGETVGEDRWQYTSPVGAFPANDFGVYGMAGNVSEHVADCVNGDYVGAPIDGSSWNRVERREYDWAKNGSTPDGICIDHITRGLGWDARPEPNWYVRRGWWYLQMSAQFIGFRVATAVE